MDVQVAGLGKVQYDAWRQGEALVLLLLLWLRVCQKVPPVRLRSRDRRLRLSLGAAGVVLRLWLYHVSALGHAETSVDGRINDD
jgi:hypothetical protein